MAQRKPHFHKPTGKWRVKDASGRERYFDDLATAEAFLADVNGGRVKTSPALTVHAERDRDFWPGLIRAAAERIAQDPSDTDAARAARAIAALASCAERWHPIADIEAKIKEITEHWDGLTRASKHGHKIPGHNMVTMSVKRGVPPNLGATVGKTSNSN